MTEAEYTKRMRRLAIVAERLREQWEKLGELQQEIDDLLESTGGNSARVRQLVATFGEAWARRYGSPYVWAMARDVPNWKRLLRSLPSDELEARVRVYLANGSEYYRGVRHSFDAFVRNVNEFASDRLALDTAGPSDCRHDPPCRTDQEHTRRRSAELRA